MQNSTKPHFQCYECKLFYPTAVLAQQCQEWCQKYQTCNIEIIKHAISE